MNNYDDLLSNAPAEEQSPRLSKEEYTAKKQAEREAIFETSDTTALEVAGDGGRFREYLDIQAQFSRYSAVNALLIMAQKPEATQIGDFDHWKSKGGSVKAQQTGFYIIEPHKYIKEDGTPGTGYNLKKVFDISQADMRKVKTSPAPNYDYRQLLRALVHKAPVKITGVDSIPGGLGAITVPETGEIQILKGMEFADTFRCVAQELALADLSTCPDTQANPIFSAHCASYILCKKYGSDTQGFDFTDAPGVFRGMDAKGVKGELSQIRDAANDISGRMERQLGEVQKAARARDEAR